MTTREFIRVRPQHHGWMHLLLFCVTRLYRERYPCGFPGHSSSSIGDAMRNELVVTTTICPTRRIRAIVEKDLNLEHAYPRHEFVDNSSWIP
jgi:hypothetical protein